MARRSYMSNVHFHHNHRLYPILAQHGGMKRNLDGSTSNSVLADEGLDWVNVEVARGGLTLPVTILAKEVARSQRRATKAGLVYRVLVRCNCGEIIPMAKMGQHFGSKTCQRAQGGL